MVLWIAGHQHRNTITPQPYGASGCGFWGVETPSLRDYPQQFRRFQIGRNTNNDLSIFVIDVDTAAPLDGGSSPSLTSRSYAIGAMEIFPPVNNGVTVMDVQQGPGMDPATGVYNAELIIPLSQLSSGLQDEDPEYYTGHQLFQNQHHFRPGQKPHGHFEQHRRGQHSGRVHGQSIFEL